MAVNKDDKRVHFYNLDVLRFFAAFMIMIFHGYLAFCQWIHRPSFLSTDSTYKMANTAGVFVERFLHNLDTGVDFFFLISGFLITYLLLQEKQHSGKIHIGKFYLRRVLRIWPLYFLIIITAPLLCRFLLLPSPTSYSWNLLFVNNYQEIYSCPAEFPFIQNWSICVEEHFYLLWPLLIAVISPRKLIYALAVIIVASVCFRVYAFLNLPDAQKHIFLNTLSRIDILSLGGMAGWLHFHKPIRLSITKWFQTVLILSGLVLMVTTENKTADSVIEAAIKKYSYNLFFLFLLVNYLFNEKSMFNFKKKNVLHYLGKVSYGMYMLHNIVLVFVIQRILFQFDIKNLPLFWILYLGFTIGLSALFYHFFEKPFLTLKEKFAVISTSR